MIFKSIVQSGFESYDVTLECDVHQGFPTLDITGLPDTGLKEAKEKIRTALRNSGYAFPKETIIVNLSPAWLEKEGSSLEAAIALAIVFAKNTSKKVVWVAGELSLSGKIVNSPGAANVINRAERGQLVIIPNSCPIDSSLGDGTVKIAKVDCITDAVEAAIDFLEDESEMLTPMSFPEENKEEFKDPFEGIFGLEKAKRALTIAVAGGLNVLFVGPRGAGKTLLLGRAGLLLAPLTPTEVVEGRRLCECFECSDETYTRTLRLNSGVAVRDLITPKRGNSSALALSHNGIVIMDELTEFNERTLSVIREANDRCSLIGVASSTINLNFSIIAAMNPCPCGKLGLSDSFCECSPQSVRSHWNKIPNSFISRFDMVVEMSPFLCKNSTVTRPKSNQFDKGKQIRDSIIEAKRVQLDRQGMLNGIRARRADYSEEISQVFDLFPSACDVREALQLYSIARTIADMKGRLDIERIDADEAEELHMTSPKDHFIIQ